jgi:flagellar assembly protein FliH
MEALFKNLADLGLAAEMPAVFAPRPLDGVLFAEDFDGPMVVEAAPDLAEALPPEPEPVAPTFSEAELEIARAEAFAAGRQAGDAAAAAARELDRVAALERIAAGLASAGQDAVAAVEAAVEGAAALLLQMICRTLPTLSAAHGEREVQAVVRSLLPALAREPRATIRVNPAHLDAVSAEIEEFSPDAAARIAILPAAAMAPGDAAIHWEAGSAKREAAAIQTAIEEALAGLGLLAPKMNSAQPGKQEAGREMAHVG